LPLELTRNNLNQKSLRGYNWRRAGNITSTRFNGQEVKTGKKGRVRTFKKVEEISSTTAHRLSGREWNILERKRKKGFIVHPTERLIKK